MDFHRANCSAKLPKWFGERPGKKPGDPESPDDEDEGPAEAPPGNILNGQGQIRVNPLPFT